MTIGQIAWSANGVFTSPPQLSSWTARSLRCIMRPANEASIRIPSPDPVFHSLQVAGDLCRHRCCHRDGSGAVRMDEDTRQAHQHDAMDQPGRDSGVRRGDTVAGG